MKKFLLLILISIPTLSLVALTMTNYRPQTYTTEVTYVINNNFLLSEDSVNAEIVIYDNNITILDSLNNLSFDLKISDKDENVYYLDGGLAIEIMKSSEGYNVYFYPDKDDLNSYTEYVNCKEIK